MNDLQALITGALIGALMREVGVGTFLDITVEPVMDDFGNYLPEIAVTGKRSGTRLLVKVVVVEEGASA